MSQERTRRLSAIMFTDMVGYTALMQEDESSATMSVNMAAAVFSHFVLDLAMHPADLALWPGSDVHLGFGLWRLLPTGWWFFELGLVVLLLGYYWRRSKTERSFGGKAVGVVATVLILHILNSPWLSAL